MESEEYFLDNPEITNKLLQITCSQNPLRNMKQHLDALWNIN